MALTIFYIYFFNIEKYFQLFLQLKEHKLE